MCSMNNYFTVETLLVVTMSIALNETFTSELADSSTPDFVTLATSFETKVVKYAISYCVEVYLFLKRVIKRS